METELLWAIMSIATLSVLAYFAGSRQGRWLERGGQGLFAMILTFSLIYAWTLSESLAWAKFFPAANVICWANVIPVLVAYAAGLAKNAAGMSRFTRPATVFFLCMIGLGFLIHPVARPLFWPVEQQRASSHWSGDVCLQSHPSTCAPAAAATLLKNHNIAASEELMIHTCLTSRHGTTPLGLYRGVAMGAKTRGLRAEVASSDPRDWASSGQLPNISLIQFSDADVGGSRRLSQPIREGHAVVVLAITDGKWLIADPAVGLVQWSHDDFRRRFSGDAVFIR